MTKILIKPLSVNKCWQGKRYKTQEYRAYEQELLYKLPTLKKPELPIKLYLKVGMSRASDVDNVLKPLLDILQKKYGFNDSGIYLLEIIKEYAPKGSEYIDFNFK